MRKNEEEQGVKLLQYGKTVLFGGVVAFIVSLLCLLLASVGISQGFLSADLKTQLAVIACVIGSFCGGLFAVRQCPARGLIVGLAVGVVLFLLQLTLGLLLYDTLSLENGGLGLLCGSLCGGAAAGILGGGGRRPSPTKGKKRRKR